MHVGGWDDARVVWTREHADGLPIPAQEILFAREARFIALVHRQRIFNVSQKCRSELKLAHARGAAAIARS